VDRAWNEWAGFFESEIREIMSANVKEFTDDNFQSEVLDSSQPVLVDFWAPWCGPCRQIAPMVEDLAAENEGTVKVGKVNIDDNPSYAQQYGVNAIPTLMIFKSGRPTDTFVGVRPKSQLQSALDAAKG
jgi:thioredoxin 1